MGIVDTAIGMADGHGAANSALGNIGRATGSYANIIKSLTRKYKSPQYIRDLYTNGFLPGVINSEGKNIQSNFVPKFFARAYDEPTYLTFRIEFIFEDEIRNTVYNDNNVFYKSLKGILPTYDFMPEPFLENAAGVKVNNDENNERVKYFEGIEQTQQALDGGEYVKNETGSSRYSTEHYLRKSLGEYRRANMLKTFKEALKDIQNVYPFYFTSISGLQNLTNVDPKRGMRLKDAVITIDCLEALDQRITYLLNLYRKIVWDDVYQRWVVPDMMRYFGMKIYVSEIRLFHTWMPNAKNIQENKYTQNPGDLNNSIYPIKKDADYYIGATQNAVAQGTAISNSFLGTQSNITKAVNIFSSVVDSAGEVYAGIKDIMNDLLAVDNAINHVMPTICYECHMCEFDISETMSHIDSLNSYRTGKAITPKIKIKVGQVREYQDYPLNKFLKMDSGVYKFDGTGNYDDEKELKDVGIRLNDDLLSKRRQEFDEHKIATETSNAGKEHNPSNPAERLNYTAYPPKKSDEPYGIQTLKYSPELVTIKTSTMALTTALLNEGLDISRRFINDDTSAGNIALDHLGRNSTATYQDKNNKNNLNAVKIKLQEEDRKHAENNATSIVYNEYIKDKSIDDYFVTNTVNGKGTPANRKELEFEIQDTSIKSTTEKEINNFYIAESYEPGIATTQTDAEKAISSGYKNRFPDSGKSEATQIEEDAIAKSREEYRNSIKEFESRIFDETFWDDSDLFPNIRNIDKVNAIKDMLNAALEKIYKGGEIQSMAVSDQMKAKIAEDMFDEFLKDLETSKATNNNTLKRFLSVYRTIQEEDKYGKSQATMKSESEDLRKKYISDFEKLN